jgi:hypothetical protein
MNSSTSQGSSQGSTLLAEVERILMSDAEILRIVKEEAAYGPAAADRIIARFSNRSAVAGAIGGAPSLVPGWGLLGAFGTAVVEMTYVMKTEVEMCLALASHHGLDITRREEREWGFLLASVAAHDAVTGRDLLRDLGAMGWEALWKYSPREVSKAVAHAFGAVAIAAAAKSAGRGVLRAIPLVGVVAGASVNKMLTRRVGRRAVAALRARPVVGDAG